MGVVDHLGPSGCQFIWRILIFGKLFNVHCTRKKNFRDENVSLPEMSRGWTCLRAGLVSVAWNCGFIKKLRRRGWEGAKISQGQTCPSTFGPDLSQGWTCLGAELVLEPNLSQDRTCFRARLIKKLRGRKCPKASGPEVSESLGLEVSHGRTWFAAVSVLELSKFLG